MGQLQLRHMVFNDQNLQGLQPIPGLDSPEELRHGGGQCAGIDLFGDVPIGAGGYCLLIVPFHREGAQHNDHDMPGFFVGLKLAG